jgi:hypothetical protein
MEMSQLKNGMEFDFHGTVYRIDGMTDPTLSLIPTIPVRREGASPLWKPNRTSYQFFAPHHIIEFMGH